MELKMDGISMHLLFPQLADDNSLLKSYFAMLVMKIKMSHLYQADSLF